MAIIEKVFAGGGTGVFIVEFEPGDPLVADDAATVPMDFASVSFRSTLDRHMNGWNAKSLYLATSIMPGDGLQVAVGTNKTGPYAVGCAGHSIAGDVWTFDTTIDLNLNPSPTVELDLIGSIIADGKLDAGSAYRILVVVGPKHGRDKSAFDSLPQTATANGA